MPLYRNKHQPYFADPQAPNNFACEGAYCYPVQTGDTVYLQFYQTPCGQNELTDPNFEDVTLGAELLTNGAFTGSAAGWTLGTGWSYSANSIVHAPGNTAASGQTGLSLTQFNVYRVVVVMTRTAGSIQIALGTGTGESLSDDLETTGTHTFDMVHYDSLDNDLYILPSSDFAGSIDSVSLRQVTYDNWDLNGAWLIGEDGTACKTQTGTGALEETVADYLDQDVRYRVQVTISNYQGTGSIRAGIGGTLSTPISGNGTHQVWVTPGADGVLSIVPTSGFIGCISGLDVRAMKNSFQFDAITELGDGDVYDISDYVTYEQDYVTLIFDPEDAGLPVGCFLIRAYDTCTVQYEELVTNGDFEAGSTGWFLNNTTSQYSFATPGQVAFIFPDPAGPFQVSTPILKNQPNPVGFIVGANYEVTFRIVSNPDPVNFGVRVTIDSTTTHPWAQSVGVHTFNLTYAAASASGNAYRAIVIANFAVLGIEPGPGTHQIVVTDVSIRRVEPFDATYTSDCINYQSEHYNTKLLTGICDPDGFGFEFNQTGFKLQMRAVVRSYAPDHNQSAVIAKYSDGSTKVTYAESEKYWQLVTEFMSESAHDALAVMKLCDHFLIGDDLDNSIEYVPENDSYSPQWIQDGSYSLAPAVIKVRVKENGQVFNRDS